MKTINFRRDRFYISSSIQPVNGLSFDGVFGVHKSDTGLYVVSHLDTRLNVARFTSQRNAKMFILSLYTNSAFDRDKARSSDPKQVCQAFDLDHTRHLIQQINGGQYV